MAKGKPAFSPVPYRAMSDCDLTALDHRVLQCICWHDRLSISRRSKGCYASNILMAEEVGCTITSLSRAISKLVKAGYLERDRSGVPGKKHLTVYRVFFEEAPVAQRDKYKVNSPTEASHQSFARPQSKNGGNLVETAAQEISLSEEIDSEESMEKNSTEVAIRGSCVPEQAPFTGAGATAKMSEIERRFRRAPRSFSEAELRDIRRYLKRVHERGAIKERQHALRLIDDFHDYHFGCAERSEDG